MCICLEEIGFGAIMFLNTPMKNHFFLIAIVICTFDSAIPAWAEEGGSAHYLPGAMASFIDAFPAKPGGLALLNYFTYYDASTPPNRTLPLGGLLAADVDATIYANTVAALYQPRWNVLGGGLAFGVAVPYVWLEVDGQAQRIQPDGTPGPVFSVSDKEVGIGDMTIYPFLLG
jgi:hypothetical protein